MRNRVMGTWQEQAQQHGAGARQPCLEIVIFATAPECQGRGCGSALLRFLGEVAGSRNAVFYAKKGGFEEGGGVAMRVGVLPCSALRAPAVTK
jgi:GNAT superfamily N-acetyltransferase